MTKYKLKPGCKITLESVSWTLEEIMDCFEPLPESDEIEPIYWPGSDVFASNDAARWASNDAARWASEVTAAINALRKAQ